MAREGGAARGQPAEQTAVDWTGCENQLARRDGLAMVLIPLHLKADKDFEACMKQRGYALAPR